MFEDFLRVIIQAYFVKVISLNDGVTVPGTRFPGTTLSLSLHHVPHESLVTGGNLHNVSIHSTEKGFGFEKSIHI